MDDAAKLEENCRQGTKSCTEETMKHDLYIEDMLVYGSLFSASGQIHSRDVCISQLFDCISCQPSFYSTFKRDINNISLSTNNLTIIF